MAKAHFDTATVHWGVKSEIPNPKHETNPKHKEGNDQNQCARARFEHWAIGDLNLFRISCFGFRASALCAATVSGCARMEALAHFDEGTN